MFLWSHIPSIYRNTNRNLNFKCQSLVLFLFSDQIPLVVTLSQTGDINPTDQSVIQNRPVTFNVAVHDPSQYLTGSDITFTWDFGDNSGTLISRQPSVTHTYLSTGSYRPQLVLMASIPNGCVPNPTAGGIVTAGELNKQVLK